MSICNSIQHGEREADCGGHEEARMTTGTVIRGEQNCTSAVEERKNWTKYSYYKVGVQKKGNGLEKWITGLLTSSWLDKLNTLA